MTIKQQNSSYIKYRPDIDGLRAVAVLAVVAFHAFPDWMGGGFIGVDIFFVISGYLISTIIFENLDKNTFSFFEFYSRRIRRIFPALILVLLVCFALGWFLLLSDELNQLGKHIAAGAGFVSNFLLWSEAGYFDSAAETKPLLHLWSLSIEEQFYIVWPLLLWFAWRRKFNPLAITIAVAVAAFIVNVKGVGQDKIAAFYSPQSRFWELLSGSVLAWITLYKKHALCDIVGKIGNSDSRVDSGGRQEIKSDIVVNILSFIGLSLLFYGFWRISKALDFPGGWALIPVLGTTLIIAAGSGAWMNRTVLSNRVVVWFGLISFPLYLWHWPLLSFARIIEGEIPSYSVRIAAIVLSIAFAWLTVKVIERPLRSGNKKIGFKVALLCSLIFVIGISGYVVSRVDFSQSHGYEKLAIKRRGFEHAFGSSLSWYRGKGDWLFLGNSYNDTVAKLKLSIVPSENEIEATRETLSRVAAAGIESNTKIVLIIGPDKSSIYPEYLPSDLVPSSKRYIDFFLNKLKDIPNLTIYDPTADLLELKKSEGTLYWMTDTHWNNKGAFLAFAGFSKLLGLPVPQIEFGINSTHVGDLVGISKLENFPLHAEDNWDVVWRRNPVWVAEEVPNEQKTAFGSAEVISNPDPLSSKYIWIVGDSFANALKPYFNSTFREVRYVGHWDDKLKDLPADLAKADRKPDMVIIVRVERAF